MDFFANDMLFGRGGVKGLLSVEHDGIRTVTLYLRDKPDAAVRVETDTLLPFLWMDEPVVFEGVEVRELAGDLPCRFLAECRDWKIFTRLRASLKDSRNRFVALSDPVQQYLTRSGRTLFRGMLLGEVRRMQIDIETWCDPEFEFPNAQRESDHLMAVALSDSTGWERILTIDPARPQESEKEALVQLGALIAERDPDVIEGHSFFNFDLPYLVERARRHKVPLTWGRDGSKTRSRPSRLQIAERTIDYTRFEIAGRHLVDTYLLVQYYDIGTRELESFGLKDVARHFGVSAGGGGAVRTYLHGKEIQKAWETDLTAFEAYALDDVRETRAISGILLGSYFVQTQMLPFNFQNVIIRGNAAKIDALFLREYLRRGHSLPDLPVPRSFEGGYTDIFFTGVARDVWHCDVTSLYPSVMLRFGCFPAGDVLGIFEGMLRDLRTFRVEAKQRLRALPAAPDTPAERAALDSLQSTFKILINSFYGYLGFGQARFADFDAAAEVTRIGRDLLRKMVDWLNERGARVIEIDTDGIYFVPPPGADSATLEAGMTEMLPEGIDVEFDARYPAMFSYKAKNYGLLTSRGEVVLKGAALKSRGLEKFQRVFLQRMIRHLLEGGSGKIAALRAEFELALRERQWPVEMFMKTDTLQESPASYQRKTAASSRNRSAAYELALASGRDYRAGDQVSYYITGDRKRVTAFENSKLARDWDARHRDENVAYYLGKLEDLAKKFTGQAGADEGQGTGDLFA